MSLNENADILHSILRTVVLVLTPCVCNVAVGTPRFPRFFSQAILHPVIKILLHPEAELSESFDV